MAVLVGRDGLVLVDAKLESFSDATVAAVRKLSDKPVRYRDHAVRVAPSNVGGTVAGKLSRASR